MGLSTLFFFEEHCQERDSGSVLWEKRTEVRVLVSALPVISHGTLSEFSYNKGMDEFKQKRIGCH